MAWWGPPTWTSMHAIAHHFPDTPTPEESRAAAHYFNSLKRLLPCRSYCRPHYCAELAKDPVEHHVHSKAALTRWLWALHNRVNERLGKPLVAFEEAVRRYETDPKKNPGDVCPATTGADAEDATATCSNDVCGSSSSSTNSSSAETPQQKQASGSAVSLLAASSNTNERGHAVGSRPKAVAAAVFAFVALLFSAIFVLGLFYMYTNLRRQFGPEFATAVRHESGHTFTVLGGIAGVGLLVSLGLSISQARQLGSA